MARKPRQANPGSGESGPGASGPLGRSRRTKAVPAVDAAPARAMTDELLAVADARFHSLAYMVADAVVVTDAETCILFANPAADRLFEQPAGSLAGQQFSVPLRATKSGGLTLSLPSGRLLDVEASIAATVWDGTIAWMATFRPPGAAAEASAGMPGRGQAAGDAALEALQARFLAHLSHELRTPLNSLLGFSELLAAEAMGPIGSAAYRDYARAVHQSGQDLLRTVSDLLNLSRASTAQLPLDESVFDLLDVVNEVVPAARALPRASQAALNVRADAPMLVRGDRDKLRSAVLHLLGNGLAFTPDSGRVDLQLSRLGDGRLLLKVSDTGRGISPAGMRQAFRAFARQQPVDLADPQAGIGVGLALVRAYFELHGGSVRIDSREGEGTSVSCLLPQNRIELHMAGMAGTGGTTRH